MAFAVVAHRCLQDHRPVMPTGILDQSREDLEAQVTLAQVGVTVLLRSSGVTGVVEMEAGGLAGAEELLSLLEKGLVTRCLVYGVASGEGVTGIQAEAELSVALGSFDNGRELLQLMTDQGSLPGGVLQKDPGPTAGPSGVDLVERLGDTVDPFLVASSQVGSGMHHESWDPESVTAIQLVAEGRSRASKIVGIDRSEIHQIGRVGYQSRDLAVLELLLEAFHVGVCERFARPLAGVLDKDLNGIAGQFGSSGYGAEDSACDGNMGSE